MLDDESNALLTASGPDTPLGALFRCFWVPCLLSCEVPAPDSEPVQLTVMGEELVAFRDSSGTVGLLDAYCAHRGAPLFYGRNEELGLRCLYHGWKYDVGGKCVDMPNEPSASRFKERICLKSYRTVERGGVVWAYMGREAPPEMPTLEWLSLPDDHVYIDKYLVESNYLQALEGDHDSSHATFLHATLSRKPVWQHPASQLSDYHMADQSPELHILETDYGILTGARRLAAEDTYFWRIVPWLMPFYSLIASEPGTPLRLNVRVPKDDESSWFFRVSYHPNRPLAKQELDDYRHGTLYSRRLNDGTFLPVENRTNNYLIDRTRQRYDTFSGIRSVPAQDRAVSERAAPWRGRRGIVDRSRENLASADAAIVQIRKRLLQAVQDLVSGQAPALARNGEAYFVRAPAVELPRDVQFAEGAESYIVGRAW